MNANVSQFPVEVIVEPNITGSKVSQMPIEVLYTLRSLGNALVSQLAVEILIPYEKPAGKKKYGPFIQFV